ncbi:MAG: CxxC-x17-CxxC domain-containing protein [Dehalococcoidia bacterium]
MFQDKTLDCAECGEQFVFSADDQQYHSERGYTDPKRCPACRRSRRSQLGSSGGGNRADRPMYPAVCAKCGRDTEVPFQPSGDRPVYCNECFAQQRSSSGY